jgi:hypothetical protein
MMRRPSGSVPPSAGTCIDPAIRVFGTSFVSTTRIHFRNAKELK